ncbi:MAG: spore germination protein [Clostridium sp.]|jgi:spore germination protein (amino acid permease)|uniref:GerAB/ArcD/ProY family transporter n=1 Tax=Clostridium sp. TaxID=1506 RepID=UPI0025C2F199|nr:endospore germination permease [Clostridium sp.]MCH3965936.1 spore germination protein [Clostridium sp.]MCI1715975.1 spore germination protein [Clostridium sp.]MCI1800353.1 spore germination protein [Clostridium sp.]MCI1814152.1 spore germination protein [Clostridium sp.]MCI1871051.1 spore germination protein [Clostridium sp.]
MIREGNIGLYETVCIVMIFLLDKIFYTSTAVIVYKFGTAAWYCTVMSCILSILFFLIICILMRKFPGHNIIEIFELVLGKFIGKITGIAFCIYFTFYTSANLREFVDMIKSYNLPRTPASLIIIIILILTAVIVCLGFETIGRLCAVVFLPVIFGIVIIFLMASPNYNMSNLAPYLGYGILNTLKGAVVRSSAYSEVVILFFIVNSIHGIDIVKRAGIISLVLAGTIFGLTTLCYLMTFTYGAGSENISGLFELSRVIYFSRFIERVESLFLVTWIVPTILNTAVGFYMAVSIYCQVFDIKNHIPPTVSFLILLFVGAVLPENFSQLLELELVFIREYSFILNYLIPVFVLIVSIVMKKGGRKSDVQKN